MFTVNKQEAGGDGVPLVEMKAEGTLNVIIICEDVTRSHTFCNMLIVLLSLASSKRSSQEAPWGGESQTLLPILCAVSRTEGERHTNALAIRKRVKQEAMTCG
jgi:hypothetical protein